MSFRVGARRRFNVGFAFIVLVVGMVGGAFALFEPAAHASNEYWNTTTSSSTTSSSSTSTSSSSSTSTSTSTTEPRETTTTTVPEESTTTTVPQETSTTIVRSGSSILTTTTLGEQAVATTTDPEVPGQLPRTGSGSGIAAMFAILSIAAGGLLIAGRRKPWIS